MTESIAITLDGIEVSGHRGMTILELAQEIGIAIPTLCSDPHLRAIGACRICLVEDEKKGTLHAACVTPIAPGMVINTCSPRVIAHRKTVVKLMLASHPDSCLVCDKGNQCKLRTVATDLGIGLVDLYRMPHYAGTQELNPFIQRDLSKCILCGKCIRADQELVGVGAIDYIHRGFNAKPTTLLDQPLEASECTFCGTCVVVCPTGALSQKGKRHPGTVSKEVATVCPFCGCGCSIVLGVKDNAVVEAKPQIKLSPNQLTLCVRGHYGWDFIHHASRLEKPLIKKEGGLVEATWEEALTLVASRLQALKDAGDGTVLGVIGSAKLTNEDNYLLQKFSRCVLQTNHIDHGGRLYASSTQTGLMMSLGWGAMTNPLTDLEKMDLILLVGAHPTETAPLAGYKIKRAVRENGAKLITIDPKINKLAPFSWRWLRPNPGSDLALFNGLIHLTPPEKLWDKALTDSEKKGFKKLKESVKAYTPKRVEKLTGISAADLKEVARAFAQAERVAVVYGSGIMQHNQSTLKVLALANLILRGGKLGRKGEGIYPLFKENNTQGASDMGVLPDFLPGFQSLEDQDTIKRFEHAWNTKIPKEKGGTVCEFIQKAEDGILKGLFIVGENPVCSFPHRTVVEKALGRLAFLVVQDLFLTETALLADVVLPAASFAEKDGTFTSMERRIQRVRKAIAPLGESKPDWLIIAELSTAMGYPMKQSSPEEIMQEIAHLVPLYAGVSYQRLEHEEVFWPCPKGGQPAVQRLYEASFPKGKGQPVCLDGASDVRAEEKKSHFFLMSQGSLFHQGSGTRTKKSYRLQKMLTDCVEMHPQDMTTLQVNEDAWIKLTSSAGELTTQVKGNPYLPPGMIGAYTAMRTGAVNRLMPLTLDPLSKTPEMKMCRVRVERIE